MHGYDHALALLPNRGAGGGRNAMMSFTQGMEPLDAADFSVSACCIVFSIDRMSVIAAACGDAIAAQVCQEVWRRLLLEVREVLGARSVVADDDGDNLILHAAGGLQSDLDRRVRRLIGSIAKRPVMTNWGDIHFTISAGGAVSAIARIGSRWMVAWANHALADARGLGGNRVKITRVASHLAGWFRHAMWVVGRVCDAHAAGRMNFSFQPVIGRDGEVFYYECLLRATDEFGNRLLPGEFIPIMEQMGAIDCLDRFAFDQVVAELRSAPGVSLGCNISGRNISDPVWMADVIAVLRTEPDIAKRLIIEITETAIIADLPEAVDLVAQVRATGCRVALDDFGSGFASFAHLRALDVDIVKLDQSFLENNAGTAAWLDRVAHLVGLVSDLGVQIVVEGVQSRDQLAVLELADVTYFQGFCVGAPTSERPWKEGGADAAFSRRSEGQIVPLTHRAR